MEKTLPQRDLEGKNFFVGKTIRNRLVVVPDLQKTPIGARIRFLRKRQGLTIPDLERLTGISHGTISRLERVDIRGPVDWWPFTRIIVTAATLGLAAHVFLGWQVRPRELLALSGQSLGVLSILALISFVLADLYLLLFLGPLYVVGVLNDGFYAASRWACRAVFRLRSAWLLALGGLLGEILLFSGLAYLVRRVLL